MDISHIEHIGIAVPSLDEAIPFYENMLGFKCFAIEEVADQKAFAVQDGVANALAEVEAKGCRLIDKAPRKGAEGLNIAFLHPKSTIGTLVELCEDPNK